MRRALLGIMAALAATAVAGGCAKEAAGPAAGGESRVAVNVAPLDLPGLSDVVWTLTVKNGAATPVVVMQRDVGSAAYGAADGSLSFVGPCDGQANPNTVTLELARLVAEGGEEIPASAYAAPPPLTKPFTCVP
ncbi:MAG: hypothetical protein KC635_12065, partial [Myxococcales bacterium]|nr:hypothetical protein [Myxococcales bacterium]